MVFFHETKYEIWAGCRPYPHHYNHMAGFLQKTKLVVLSTLLLMSVAEIYIYYRVLRTIQMKLILLCVWAEQAFLGSGKSTLKFKYEI